MLRRSDITVLIRPNHAWPLWSSLLLHVAVFFFCCIPHAPKVHDCIMVDLEMPRLGSRGPMGGVPAHRPKNVPAGKAAAPAPTAVAARHEPHKQTLPSKPQAAPVPEQKTNVPQTPIRSLVDRGTDTSATARGQAASASAQTGGTGSGAGKGNASGKSSGAGGTGSGGSGGLNQPVDGVFGAQGGPSYLHKVLPSYPRFARRLGKEGTVLLRLTLDESGALRAVEIVEKGGYGFDEAAVAAVRASRFKPAIHHGVYVAVRAMLPVRFELKD